MRYLLAVWDGGGATPPNLGAARLLVARDHEVVVLADPTLVDAVAATGAAHRAWTTAPHRRSTALEDDVLSDWECRTPIGAFRRLRDRLVTGPADRFAADVAAELDRADRTGGPYDAVLADGFVLGALVVAEARGIPVATLTGSTYARPTAELPPYGTGLAPARGPIGRTRDRAIAALVNRSWDGGLRDLNTARARQGLDPLAHVWEQWDRADRVIMLTAAAFDHPGPRPANVRYVGPVLEDIPSDAVVDLPPGDDPLVVVGLSSSYMEQGDLLRRIAVALAALPVRGVITTGPVIDPGTVPSAPNVRVVGSAPHRDLMPRASLVVTHAGHGTLFKALAAGVPVVCIPLGRDQPDNAARARRLGVGRTVKARAGASTIAEAVRDALADAGMRDAARDLGDRIRAEVESSALVDELESLARTTSTA